MDNLDAFFEASQTFAVMAEQAKKEYELETEKWWNNLSYEERRKAFYEVTRRIYQGDIESHGSYRYVLYNVFGFEPDMYVAGMDSGYMAIHNCLCDGEELEKMRGVNRFEVIDSDGRSYVKYLKDGEGIMYSLQDDNKTLKVFIDNFSWKEQL